MNHTNQYYFSVPKLKALLDQFEQTQISSMKVKGFVFTPGHDGDGEAVVYAFPLLSNTDDGRAGKDGDILIQNLSLQTAGCPYPPKCQTLAVNEAGCYINE